MNIIATADGILMIPHQDTHGHCGASSIHVDTPQYIDQVWHITVKARGALDAILISQAVKEALERPSAT